MKQPTAIYRVLARSCLDGAEIQATAVVVSDELLATVAHALDGADDLRVISATDQGRPLDAELVHLDLGRDLALLRLPAAGLAPPPLDAPDEGMVVTIVAATAEGVTAKSATVDQLIDLTWEGEGRRAGLELRLQGVGIEAGDSGAPVINQDGTVVGLVFGADRDQPTGWALSAVEIEAALNRAGRDPLGVRC